MDTKFVAGDLVFAKVKGHPCWPAKIAKVIDPKLSNSKYKVIFFGTGEYALCREKNIFSYDSYKHLYGKQQKNEKLNRGLLELKNYIRDVKKQVTQPVARVASPKKSLKLGPNSSSSLAADTKLYTARVICENIAKTNAYKKFCNKYEREAHGNVHEGLEHSEAVRQADCRLSAGSSIRHSSTTRDCKNIRSEAENSMDVDQSIINQSNSTDTSSVLVDDGEQANAEQTHSVKNLTHSLSSSLVSDRKLYEARIVCENIARMKIYERFCNNPENEVHKNFHEKPLRSKIRHQPYRPVKVAASSTQQLSAVKESEIVEHEATISMDVDHTINSKSGCTEVPSVSNQTVVDNVELVKSEQRIKRMQLEIENLSQELETLKERIQKVQQEKQVLQNDKEVLKRDKRELLTDKQELLRDKQELQQDKRHLQQDKENLLEDKRNMQGDKRRLLRDTQKLKQDFNNVQEDKQKLEEKYQKLQQDIQLLKQRLDFASNSMSSANRKLKNIADIIEEQLKCGVCLSVVTHPVMLNCNHIFCMACVVNCKKHNIRCPWCRTVISSEKSVQILDNCLDKILTHLPGNLAQERQKAIKHLKVLRQQERQQQRQPERRRQQEPERQQQQEQEGGHPEILDILRAHARHASQIVRSQNSGQHSSGDQQPRIRPQVRTVSQSESFIFHEVTLE